MEHMSAFEITVENHGTLAYLSGYILRTLSANIGWYALYNEDYMPRWLLMPKRILDRDFPNATIKTL